LEGSGEISLSQHEARSNEQSVQSKALHKAASPPHEKVSEQMDAKIFEHTEASTTKKPKEQSTKSLGAKKGK
jgi:hypothetical protein